MGYHDTMTATKSFLRIVTGILACMASGQTVAADSLLAFTKPTAGSVVTGRLMVEVSAAEGIVITNLDIKLNGANFVTGLHSKPFVTAVDTSSLLNGIHNLQAVAKDAGGAVISSAGLSFTVANPPAYTLTEGPYPVEDLGVLIASCSQEHQVFFLNTNGDAHLIMDYYGGSYNQLLDVNLTQGKSRVLNGPNGSWRRFSRGVAYRNGIFYYCNPNIYSNGTYHATFHSYNLATGATSTIGNLTQHAGYHMEWGDDGLLYIGSFSAQDPPHMTGGADMARYNSNTGTLENLGKVDPEHAAQYSSQYAYWNFADSNYCYVVLGQDPWYLGVINTQTGSKSNYFAGSDKYGELRRATNGALFYLRRQASLVETWYALSNGVPTALGNTPGSLIPTPIRAGVVDQAAAYTNLTGFNFDLGLSYPDSSNNVVTVGYSTNGSGVWNFVTASNFNLTAAGIRRCYSDDTNLFLLSFLYGPWLRYNPANSNVFRYGTAPYEIHDAVKQGSKWYLCGYTAVTMEFDPKEPWTFTIANPGAPSANPKKLPLALRSSEYFSGIGSDGLLYVASHLARGTEDGGKIGWYNRADNSYGSLLDPVNIASHDVADFKPILGGTRFVYSTVGANLMVFDTTTKTVLSTNAPIATKSPGKVVEVANGVILGLSGTNIYRWDCTTSSLVWSNNLSGMAFGTIMDRDRRVELGPDGCVWAFVSKVLNRINPADGRLTPILTNDAALNVMFHGKDMYLYGGPKFYRIRNVLKSTQLEPATSLQTLQQ